MRAGRETISSSTTACWSEGACAERYECEVNRVFYQAALARLLAGAPVLAGRGLDLGCGTGFSTEVLLAEVPEVRWLGVDASGSMLAAARRKPSLWRVELRQACAESLPFADASFDVVVASFSWHWFGREAGPEVRRVLRPGGWLLAAVPVRWSSSAAGNRLMARALLAARRRGPTGAHPGLHLAEVAELVPAPVRFARNELRVEPERFADGQELLDVLGSRGALDAVFGAHPPARLDCHGPLDFEWPYALVHAQV